MNVNILVGCKKQEWEITSFIGNMLNYNNEQGVFFILEIYNEIKIILLKLNMDDNVHLQKFVHYSTLILINTFKFQKFQSSSNT